MGKASNYFPPVGTFGHKWHPEDIAGFVGLPHVGNIFYVDPTNGSDTANAGKRQDDAFATITQAESELTDYNHDVVVLVSGGTGGTAETAAVTWDKNYCHLIGNAAPTRISQRARVIQTTDEVDPCFTISGSGCIFSNVQLATYQASNDVLVNMTGDRNYFSNVHFAGVGHATAGDDSSARDLTLTGSHENTFDKCMFGLDTVARSTSNASIDFAIASKNTFSDCVVQINADNTGALMLKSTGATGCSGWNHFNNMLWLAKWTNAADKITAAIDISAQTQTSIIAFTGYQLFVGCDDIEASASSKLWFQSYEAQDAGAYFGLAVNNA